MATRTFGDGSDTINDSNASNQFFMRGGDDRVDMRGGNDRVFGGDGFDTVNGGDGNDRVFGDAQNDVVNGGLGNDVLGGGRDVDRLNGGLGRDVVDGNLGSDSLDLGRDFLIPTAEGGGDGSADVANYFVDTTTFAGRDTVFNFSPLRTVEDPDDPDETIEIGDGDLINLGRFGSFADLDSNGDDVLSDADDFVAESTTSARITLDVGRAFEVDDVAFAQSLTVVGFETLSPDMFVEVA